MNRPEITLESLKVERTQDVAILTIILDGEGIGDTDENIGVVTPERRKQQADLFRRDDFDGVMVRPDVYRYLHYFYLETGKIPIYEEETLHTLMQSGIIGGDEITDLVKYSVNNEETAQILGFILIFNAMLAETRERRMTIKLIFESPFHRIEGYPQRFLDLILLMVGDAGAIIKQIKT